MPAAEGLLLGADDVELAEDADALVEGAAVLCGMGEDSGAPVKYIYQNGLLHIELETHYRPLVQQLH